MSVYLQSVNLERGVDYDSPTFLALQSDGITPTNLASYSARLSLRTLSSDVVPQVALTQTANAQGVVTLGGSSGTLASGLVSFTITKSATRLLLDRAGIWDLLLDAPDGTTRRLASGTWTVTTGATQT